MIGSNNNNVHRAAGTHVFFLNSKGLGTRINGFKIFLNTGRLFGPLRALVQQKKIQKDIDLAFEAWQFWIISPF